MTNLELVKKLEENRKLDHREWIQIFETYSKEELKEIMKAAQQISIDRFGKNIYFRGIVEFTNICKNDCYYCGIRCSNRQQSRYRLTEEDILECCHEGYESGFRTFVLQGGEDGYFTDERLCKIIESINQNYPDCAITLSVGERSRESYQKLYDAGARRYLLRHETITLEHYSMLHPESMKLEERVKCLKDLKETGFQTGCGIMVGTPGQTPETLANDMEFMGEFQPHMVGIGPFIPHSQTPFADREQGSVDLSLLCIALTRIMLPDVLLPSTTALGTAESEGRKMGVLAGCNVVMPNLSPLSVRKKYMLYDNKVGTNVSAKEGVSLLRKQMEEIGYEVITGRGDHPSIKTDKYEKEVNGND